MAHSADVIASTVSSAIFTGGGVNYLVQTPTNVLYMVYVDPGSNIVFIKSSDRGLTWTNRTFINSSGAITVLSVWYDRWSNISGGLIHCAYTESAIDDILYRSIDTENSDSLSTETTVFAGVSTASGGALSITRARGGNLVVAGSIDAGAEDGAWESTDVGATWGSTIADPSEGATQDQYLLLPGWNADGQDVMLIFWDASANEISVKRYDDSLNTWTETSIATGMTDVTAATNFPHFAAAVDLANSRNVLVAWSAVDTANADLRCWMIDDTTIVESSANVVLNSTDDQGLTAVSIDITSGLWTVFYGGKSDGSQTWNSSVLIYYKTSSDAGATWSAETLALASPRTVFNLLWMVTIPRVYGYLPFPPVVYDRFISNGHVMQIAATPGIQPRARYQARFGR